MLVLVDDCVAEAASAGVSDVYAEEAFGSCSSCVADADVVADSWGAGVGVVDCDVVVDSAD